MQNSKLLKYLIALILIGLPSYLLRFSVLGIPTTALEIGIYILATYYLILNTRRQGAWRWPDRSWWLPLGLFVAGALVGVVISPDKREALGQFKGFIVDPLIFALLLYSALRSKIIDGDWIIKSLLVGGFLLALGAFWFPRAPDGRTLSFYWYDITANPNFLALALAPIIALSFSKTKYWMWSLGGAVMLIALLTTGSRGAFVGLGLAVLYLLYQKYQSHRKKILAFAVALIIAIAYLVRPDLSASPDSGRVASSNNIRYEIWTTTKEIITKDTKNFLFGVGSGNYQKYFIELTKDRVNYPEFIAPRALSPHNIFLAMWLNGGLLMLAGFVWLIYKALGKPDFLPAQAALVALIGHGLVDTPYFKNDLSILFWVLLVILWYHD